MSSERLPWKYCLQLSIATLRLTQEEFWQMTPQQWLLQWETYNRVTTKTGNLRELLAQAMQHAPD